MHSHTAIKRYRILILGLLFTLSAYAKGYQIGVEINGFSDTTVILAHYLNKSIYPDDTATFNHKGRALFEGDKALHQGMYIIYLPNGEYFHFLMGVDQTFKIKTDTSNYLMNAEIEGSLENELFFSFQQYMTGKNDEQQAIQEAYKAADDKKEKANVKAKMDALMTERDARIEKIITEHPDLFVATFLKATQDIKVPDAPVQDDGSIDSTWQYRYYKAHYFDNFNPHDGRLLYTPLYEQKVLRYLDKVVLQMPDTLIKEIDYLIEGARGDSALFRYLLVSLFNKYGDSDIMGMDAVQVHLAEKYYLTESWWNDEKFLDELRERVAVLKPLILNNPAPNVELLFVPGEHFPAAKNDTAIKRYPHVGQLRKIHDIEAEYTVLIFWEATCSHCKKAVPKFYNIYKEQLEPNGIKVVAISTLFGKDGKEKWVDFINKHEAYDWMNAWNPYDYDYKMKYDIRTNPQIFVLDKNKKIIGKRIGVEQVPDLIEAYKKQQALVSTH